MRGKRPDSGKLVHRLGVVASKEEKKITELRPSWHRILTFPQKARAAAEPLGQGVLQLSGTSAMTPMTDQPLSWDSLDLWLLYLPLRRFVLGTG